MKKLIVLFCVLAITIFSFGTSMAAFSFDISDAGDDGTYDLFYLTDDNPVQDLFGLNLEFQYDTAELLLTGIQTFAPAGFFPFFGPPSETSSGSGDIINLNMSAPFGPTGVVPQPIADNTLLATFSFNLLDPNVLQDGAPDLWFFDLGAFAVNIPDPVSGSVSLGINDLDLTYGVNVDKGTPVPIPSTLLILGSGLVGLVGIGRKKRSS